MWIFEFLLKNWPDSFELILCSDYSWSSNSLKGREDFLPYLSGVIPWLDITLVSTSFFRRASLKSTCTEDWPGYDHP